MKHWEKLAMAEGIELEEVTHGRWVEWPECAKYAEAYSEDHIACSVCGYKVVRQDEGMPAVWGLGT